MISQYIRRAVKLSFCLLCPEGSSWCATCLWTWPVPSRRCWGLQTGDPASSSTTGWFSEEKQQLGFLLLLLYSSTWFLNTSCPSLQGSVLPGDELVSHSYVPLLLVLCHRCHGNCRLHLQVYRVRRVSAAEPQEGLDWLAFMRVCVHCIVRVWCFWSKI